MAVTDGTGAPPDARFLRQLYRPLMDDARAEVMDCLRIAVMLLAGLPRSEMARQLGIATADVNQLIDRLRAVRDRIDREDDFFHEF